MSRSATARVQTPGATEPEGFDEDAPAPITASPEDMARKIADLEAALSLRTAEVNALRSETAQAKLPQVVYEPETPHGVVALRSSPTGTMTIAQVMAEIDAGRMKEPITSYLCADGYLARRA